MAGISCDYVKQFKFHENHRHYMLKPLKQGCFSSLVAYLSEMSIFF